MAAGLVGGFSQTYKRWHDPGVAFAGLGINEKTVGNKPANSSLRAVESYRGRADEFTVKFADGTSVQYNRVEEIIEQPNSEHRSIVSLIAGTAGEGTPSANVVLKAKAKEGEPSVEYTLSGP